ncbi:RloB-like protein [Hydrogenispora ethanolica]|jgi:hypothetical protein|uniref:RloB-like protein n=1 Tax=Hydrogenispora ethanolica TaxID=1082276 RepID=A0A4R1QQI6_HYDET|nr:RloB domain-containing protein [Hydrogenispora ethanolica]TCL56028.1 RloB-like protein [Hydrogenispora ethanolica]
MAGKSRRQPHERRQIQVYRGAYEGLQEELYLKHLKKLIHQCESRTYNVDFLFFCCGGGNPLIVAERAASATVYHAEHQMKTAIFDQDLKEGQFRQALDKCKEKEVFPAYSNLCFDLWLILHKSRFERCVNQPSQYAPIIREIYHLPAEADIKEEATILNILSQIQLTDVYQAITYAMEIIQKNSEVGEPCFTDRSVKYYRNPDLRMHQFIEKVLNDTGCNSCA